MVHSIHEKLERALSRRELLIATGATDALRLFHGAADGLDGLVIERFGAILIVQFHEGRLAIEPGAVRDEVEALMPRLGVRAAYLKHFPHDRARIADDDAKAHADPAPWLGEPVEPEFPISENSLRYLIRPYDGFSVGLFLEHRNNRNLIRAKSSGLRVLNLFSYTCGFSVAAAVGGAREVASVDLSKKYLEWGKRNFAANGIDLAPHRFYCCDAFEFFRRAVRQKRRYDLIVIDPPTFSRSRRPARVFVLQEQLDDLLAGAVEILEPSGGLFIATNDRQLSDDRLKRSLASIGGRGASVVERPALPPDFAGDPAYSRAMLAQVD